jgi:serine/threonine-protein kinase
MAELPAGTQIGDYLVEELRADGGFASVYKAVHLPTKRLAAIKVLHRTLILSPKALRRFRREVELVDRLRHPNIVKCYGFGEHTDGCPYLAMQWLEGPTLSEEIARRGRFAPDDATRAIRDLCPPLEAAHAVGVVHRDLKGSNVIAVPRRDWFELMLVDFGIAKLVDPEVGEQTALTTVGSRLGSPHSMSPEQVLGHEVDARADIYALGVLLYQLLTGVPPFVADTPEQLEDLHVDVVPVPPSRRASISSALDDVVMRCLEKLPDRRYAGVRDLQSALSEHGI